MDNERWKTVHQIVYKGKTIYLRQMIEDPSIMTTISDESQDNLFMLEALCHRVMDKIKELDSMKESVVHFGEKGLHLHTVACLQAVMLDAIFDALVDECGEGKVDPRLGFGYSAVSAAFDEAMS